MKNDWTLTNARTVWGGTGGEEEGGRTMMTLGGESKEVELTGL